MTNFERAFAVVIGVEKGFSKDPKDPGNWTGGITGRGILKGTNFGISAAIYPDEDIANLTISQAQSIYKRDYWDAHHLDDLEYGKALLIFDTSVNGGPHSRWWQMYGGYPLKDFAQAYQAEHALYLASLPNWIVEGRGWARRLFKLYDAAVAG